jgi:hypothetical protein
MQRAVLAAGEIFRLEALEVPESEVEEEYNIAAADFQQRGQEFDGERLREQIVETQQVVNFITC